MSSEPRNLKTCRLYSSLGSPLLVSDFLLYQSAPRQASFAIFPVKTSELKSDRGELVIIWLTTQHLVLCAHGLCSIRATIDEGVQYSRNGNLSSLGQVARSICASHVSVLLTERSNAILSVKITEGIYVRDGVVHSTYGIVLPWAGSESPSPYSIPRHVLTLFLPSISQIQLSSWKHPVFAVDAAVPAPQSQVVYVVKWANVRDLRCNFCTFLREYHGIKRPGTKRTIVRHCPQLNGSSAESPICRRSL